ncbi:MAG: hypothetical protein EPO02_00275 [Nitrospirae bacterium]|nr:MAG: hypothetical protein EPO02_00275 [Nitrospirota bacterium]
MIPTYMLKSIREAATRPDFYQFLNVALKDLLFGAYNTAASTYEQIVSFEDSDKPKEGYPSMGSLGLPEQVLEGDPYKEKKIGKPDFVEITNFKFGQIIAITQELIDDDQTKQIKKFPLDLGTAHKKQEDKSVYSLLTGNATCYDGNNLFSLNHPGQTGGGAIAVNDNIYTGVTMTAGALATVIAMIAQWCGHTSDDILDIAAKAIVCPKTLQMAAGILSKADILGWAYAANNLGPASAFGQAQNAFKDLNLSVVSSPRLDRVSTGDWYVQTDFPSLVFQWRERLQLLAENENSGVKFERDVLRWKSRSRWGLKFINWRGWMLVS